VPSQPRARLLIRRLVGRPVASCRVPASPPLLLERYQALFESVSVPPLPVPLLLVHTGGKPLAYQSSGRSVTTQSIPGFVTVVPRAVRAEIALRGVGEGTVIYFADESRIPGWLSRSPHGEPLTFTNEVIISLTRQLMAAADGRAERTRYLRTLGNALLAELQHALEQSGTDDRLPATRGDLRVAHTAIRHVQMHLGEPLSVKVLASACGLGVTRFTSSFHQATGLTPHRYLRKARIDRASELLRTTALSIREVSEAVGFRGQSHFCTAFTQDRGLTPSAYRRACRKAPPKSAR
jgi:AraC family transcriptional regulator